MKSRTSSKQASKKNAPTQDHSYLYQQIADKLRKEIEGGALKPGMRIPSLDQMAETHGVNRITVRRALSDLKAEGLIHAVPAEGTYVSERKAKRPQNGPRAIGLVSHVLDPNGFRSYHAGIIGGIQESLGQEDAHLVLMPEGHIRNQEKIFDVMVRAGLDGVIYMGAFEPAVLRRMVEKGPPAVLVDSDLRGGLADAIQTDNHGGAYSAIAHLHELGHRRLACMLGSTDALTTRARLEGVRAAMTDLDIPEDHLQLVEADFMRAGGRAAMEELLAAKTQPTAIFCFNDEMAAGALQAILDRGDISVPGDMSIIGYDDISWATAVHPHLTTVRVETRLMGQLAGRQIIARLKSDAPLELHSATVTPTRLIVRDSTAAPRA